MIRIENYPPDTADLVFTEYTRNQLADYASRGEGAAVQAIGGAVASFLVENLNDPTTERVYDAFGHLMTTIDQVNGVGIDLGAGFRHAYAEITERRGN